MAPFRPTICHVLVLAGVVIGALAQQPSAAGFAAVPSDEKSVAHVLNRLAFGARPGDMDRIARSGLAAWIDAQLQPQRIADDAVDRRLAALTTLTLDSETIARDYVAPARRERRQRQQANPDGRNSQAGATDPSSMQTPMEGPPFSGAMSDAIRRERQIFAELAEAKLLRAVYSERQLEGVLTDFWFNHFNVFARKGRTEVYVGEYEREAIRPHVLGSFRELLEATAKSPAMLFYLDNWMSSDPKAAEARLTRMRNRGVGRNSNLRRGQPERRDAIGGRGAKPEAPPQRLTRGLNENYARELLELHTLGVDGGYTQQDVIEVARAFTGWTIGRAGEGGFRFAAALHDRGAKNVLGQSIPAGGGVEDGQKVLDILARHPSTAHHIAYQLAQRFVSDRPPASIVDKAAKTFTTTNGNLRAVVRTIVTSPEFFAPEAYRAKVKTPFEFVVSALRATNADVRIATPLVRALAGLGMPLYLCQPPTGYDETADRWVSSGALVNRMNFALAVSGGQMRGIQLPAQDPGRPDAARDRIIRDALAGDVSAGTLATIAKATTLEQTIALAIGSPEFQRQ
jgi:uncharacterized protein (DUF1800 family)